MEPNNLEGRSRGSSFRRRALTLVGASALTLSGVGAAIFGASQAFAVPVATATSSAYSIGTGFVQNLTVSASSYTATKNAVYTINFLATDGIDAAGTISLTFTNAATTAVTGTLTDTTTGVSQTVNVAATAAGTAQTINVTNAISSGHNVSLVIGGVTNGAATTSAKVTVSTSQDTSPVTSASYTLTAAAASPTPTATASSTATNATGVTWTLGSFGVYDNTTQTATSLAAGAVLDVTIPSTTLTLSPLTNYVITDTPTSGTATTQNPSKVVSVSSSEVKLTTSAALTVGDTITITASNVTNPSAAASYTPTLAITPVAGADAWVMVNPGTAASSGVQVAATFPAVAISGTVTAVTGVTITPSPANASTSTSTNTSTFTVGFTSTNGVAATTGTITVQLGAGETIPAANTMIVTDVTAGTTTSLTNMPVSASTSPASTTNNVIVGTLPAGFSIAKGDVVNVQVFAVQNPTTTGSYTGQVSTSGDSVKVSATYTLVTPSTTTATVSVAVSNSAAGASATYTITGLQAAASLPAGSTISIGNTTAAGTNWPLVASSYTITDLTNSASTAVAATVASDAAFNGVDLTTTNAIANNDQLTITISGIINPYVGGSFKIQVNPLIAATVSNAAPTAPNAAATGSNGALVNVNGTIYVYAGGVAFGIPTPAAFNSISSALGNPTVVSASSVTTTGTVANGTLLQVVGSPEIGVVSGGAYYGFSTASQFTSEGYSWSRVIQVPNLGSLTTGSGTPPNAASTASDGALVNVNGTIYVYAGGVAAGIPTPSVFSTISAALGNPAVVNASSVTSTGNMATGTLVQVAGSPQINVVTTGGVQVGFATASEFTSDGYSWGRVILIP